MHLRQRVGASPGQSFCTRNQPRLLLRLSEYTTRHGNANGMGQVALQMQYIVTERTNLPLQRRCVSPLMFEAGLFIENHRL